MPTITITDLHNVIIDAVNSDDIFAAIRNHPDLRDALEAETLAWGAGLSNAAKEIVILNSASISEKTQRAAEIAALNTQHATTVSAHADELKKYKADVQQLLASIAAERTADSEESIAELSALANEKAAALAQAATELAACKTQAATELATEKAEFAAYKLAASKGAGAIHNVIADPTKDDATTVATITQILAYAEKVANKTAHEREVDAAQAAFDAAAAKLEAAKALIA